MNIHITSGTKLNEIQYAFSKRFPFLKLEFFKGKSASPGHRIDPSLTLEKAGGSGTGDFHFDGLQPVKDFETAFHEKFHLTVEVFRLSGKVWLQTSATNEWLLDVQNAEGRVSQENASEKPETPDFQDYQERE